jgi:hypothetical protein
LTGADDCRYIVYNASVLGNPPDHVAGRWYVRLYPVEFPPAGGDGIGRPFDTAGRAERAARAG